MPKSGLRRRPDESANKRVQSRGTKQSDWRDWVPIGISCVAVVISIWAAWATWDQAATARSQTSILDAQTALMKRQSQLDAVVTSAAVVSADVARAQVTPVVRLVYSVDETSTSQGTDWIQTIRIANSGGPIHDLTFEAYSFWEVGFGPCRADADLVYLPAFEPWFDLRDQPVSPKGDVVITGIPSLLPGQSMNSESDWLYRGDPEQRLFCRPWVYAEVSYVDSLGDAHDDWFVLTSFGPERIDAPNANLLQQLDHLKEAGLEVGSYTDTVDTVHAVIAKARATESDALDAIAKGMQ